MNQHRLAQGAGDGTVGKALELLDIVATFGRPVRFAEVLARSPHPKATTYRLIQSLTNQGMLCYEEGAQTYAPGLRLVRLAHSAWAQSALAPVARPHLDRLAQEVGETIHLAQLDQGQVLYVDKRTPAHPIKMFSQAGKIGPGYCTGVGKAMIAFQDAPTQADALKRQAFFAHTPTTLTSPEALLSELAEIRARGFAQDREEHEPGIICVAVPILDGQDHAMGGLSITSTTERHTLDELEGFVPQMTVTAQAIAAAATAWRFPT